MDGSVVAVAVRFSIGIGVRVAARVVGDSVVISGFSAANKTLVRRLDL